MKKITTIGIVMLLMLSGCFLTKPFEVSIEYGSNIAADLPLKGDYYGPRDPGNIEFTVKKSSEVIIRYKWSFDADLVSVSFVNKETNEVVWSLSDGGQAKKVEGIITLPALSEDANYEIVVVATNYEMIKVEFTSSNRSIKVKKTNS